MNILFLCHRHSDTSIGGVAEFLHHLPLALKRIGIQPYLYAQEEHSTGQLSGPTQLANGMIQYSGPFVKPGSWFISKQISPLLKLCVDEKIDLIHAQGTYRSGFMAMKVKQRNNIPYIVTSHNDILATNSRRMNRGSVKRRCRDILQHAYAVTHLTSLMAEASHQIYDTQNKSVTISNGIDIKAWERFANLPEKDYLLSIGRLEPGKGFHILLDAYTLLRQKGVKTPLIIAGTGSAEAALREQVKRLNLPEDSVIFTGYVRGDEKMRLIAESKMVLFATQPSQWEEAFSIVQLEVMAAGKAMIASDTGPTRYLQSLGLQTKLVKPDDVSAWALRIAEMLDDSLVRDQLGRGNFDSAKKFDWGSIAREYGRIYKSVINKSL